MENAEVVDAPQAEQAAAPTASLAVFDPIKEGLAVAKQRYANVVFDLKTVKGNDEARKARKELVSLRTGIDKAYTSWNQPLLEQQRKARALKEEITKEVEALEKPIDEQIKADEARRESERLERERIERERVTAIRARINEIFSLPATYAGKSPADLELAIAAAEALVEDKAFFQELQGEAEAAADVVTTKLRAMLANAQAAEAAAEAQRLEAERLAAERAELERQRAELAAQQEAARKEAERLEAERQAAAAAEAARVAAERAAAEAAEQARQAAIAEEARKAEEARLAAEREAQARLDEQRRQLDEQRAQLERDQAAARAQADAAAQQDAAEEKLLADGYTKLVSPGLNGSTVVSWAPPERAGGAVTIAPAYVSKDQWAAEATGATEEPAKPELRTQEDAFSEERAAAAQAAAVSAPKATRPADEKLTVAVAKAFGVTQFTAAEWLGTYDALAEIDRTLEQQL